MRIVHLVYSLDYGGAEKVVVNLASFQGRSGHSVRVVCLRDLGPHPFNVNALAGAGVEIVTLDKPPGFHVATLRRLVAYLRKNRTEVEHTHNHLVHHYGAVAGRLAGCRAIVNTLHGTATLRMAFWSKVLFWFSCLLGHRVVSVCRQVHDVFRSAYRLPRKMLCVVENGIDLSPFAAVARRAPGEGVTFGNIARFDPVKDHENLLRAFAIVRCKHPAVRLRLLGDGVLLRDMTELARSLSIAESVHFEGFSLDTPSFLGKIDVYVISSRSEGLPLTLLEAMGAGLPVVATAVGGITEILDDSACGWLCPPGDPGALAETMEKALTAPDLSARGARGRDAVEKRYSVQRMARDYDILYGKILAERGANGMTNQAR
jgi:glycosyltransferase involved in cell wall biosynthesis